jgi:CxxC motif-containing protein|tara:strand:+ start:343 stop:567 length:225 start_codon:yes stop_codon:yes gene_type:complete
MYGRKWLKELLNILLQDLNQRRGHVYTKRERTNPKSAILKNITVKADELARQYNKTKDSSIRDQWYKLLRSIPK